ncbi:MAG: undecaprenyl-diphosphate phosphatase, partial [Actinobacteria bacterium]|nr:undecaprenyl-diphosphate phosphatase [Actinomycetota bacterium]
VGAREAALAALAQVAALAPGVSRSGATLTALRAAGVDRAPAQRFSLLMSLPVTAGAAVLTLARSDRTTLRALSPSLATGATCAGLAGAAAAWTQQRRPGRSATGPALYRLGLAAVVARRVLAEHRSSRKDLL